MIGTLGNEAPRAWFEYPVEFAEAVFETLARSRSQWAHPRLRKRALIPRITTEFDRCSSCPTYEFSGESSVTPDASDTANSASVTDPLLRVDSCSRGLRVD